jgi:tRNA pseudouridine38-40 synthase
MVGCLKYLGDGHWNFKNFEKSFQAKKRFKCAPPAPACGLYLKKITY